MFWNFTSYCVTPKAVISEQRYIFTEISLLLHLNMFGLICFLYLSGNISGEFLVGIVLQIKQKKCLLKLLTEYILLKKHKRFHLDIDYICSFCNCKKESIVHFFFECPCSSLFWSEMSQFLSVKMNCILVLNLSFVLHHSNEYDFFSIGKYLLLIWFCY